MSNDLAVIFIYTDKDDITEYNLQALKNNNPELPIFDICQQDFANCHFQFLDIKPIKYWSKHEIWYWGSDNIFLHWYLTQKVRAKNYLIIEGDTYTDNISIYDFFGQDQINKNEGITGIKYIEYKNDPNYHWFKEQENNQFIDSFYTKDHFKCCTPLCGTLISDKCVNEIINHISTNYFANKLYVETKFATIASYLGFTISTFKKPLESFITYNEDIIKNTMTILAKSGNTAGMFHPVKNLSTIKNGIASKNISSVLKNNKIHKAIYGKVVDVKEAINKLHELLPNEKIQINNFLAGDPAHGVGKELYLTYEKNNQIFEIIIKENEWLDFNAL